MSQKKEIIPHGMAWCIFATSWSQPKCAPVVAVNQRSPLLSQRLWKFIGEHRVSVKNSSPARRAKR